MRRRYRTATQLAIARGEPPPNMRDDYWGLGRLSAWPPDGLDTFGMVPGMEGMYGRGERRIRKPEMWEAEVDGKAEWDQEWEDTQVRLL